MAAPFCFSGTIPLLIFPFHSLSCHHLFIPPLESGRTEFDVFSFFFFPPPRPAPETDLVISGIYLPLPLLDSQPCPWCPAAKVFVDNLPNWTRAICFSGSPFPPASSESLARSNPVSMPGRNSGAVEGERLWVHWTQWPTLGKSSGEQTGRGGSINAHGRCGTASQEF